MALNKPTNAASGLLESTVNEFTVAVANAKNRLNGIPSDGAAAVVTPQQVQDEADAATWATLQGFVLLADCKDQNVLNTVIKALTPASGASAAQQPAASK